MFEKLELFWSVANGFFLGGGVAYFAAASVLAVLVLGFTGAPLWLWTLVGAALATGFGAPALVLAPVVAVSLIFIVKPLRRAMVSAPIMALMKKLGLVPRISETERTALEAGVVWIEGDLFSGKPDFAKLMKEPYPELTKEEQAFMDGPVEELCKMVDDWEIWQNREIPRKVWDFLGSHGFFGMIIPKAYGGLEFSALAHSAVIAKVVSRSSPVAVSLMVPNSLGPAELLVHYGTEEQRKHYLPRLAKGIDIPCFALTEPQAGSDAGSIKSDGILFKGDDGKLYVRLNWNKRWITLAGISTILGLAFRLKDPEKLLGKGEDLGITCALIPSDAPGVVLGRRHDPLFMPFYNCPTQGHDVVVSADQIIGGVNGAGIGWKMLMESLGAGRGISLPAQSTGGCKLATRMMATHAAVRKQFGVAIGKFEGIEEPLARIGGYTYLMEAFRKYTLGALDQGIKPPVVTAIAKYHSTELARKLVNDAMDIAGGAGISRGRRNMLAHYYAIAPISITVEGANILTRTLIIFGQGALRAHPFAYKEVKAVETGDLKAFDEAFWGHMGHIGRNLFRAVLLNVTRGWLAPAPFSGPTAKYFRQLSWVSAQFAIMADIAMASLGASLKMKEKITGRFADILSWMYIGTAVLRRFEADGRPKEDLPYVEYSMRHGFGEIQRAFDGIFANLKVPGLTWFFRSVVRHWWDLNALDHEMPDELSHRISKSMMTPGAQRDRHTDGIFLPTDRERDHVARMEHAFLVVTQAENAEKKIRRAIRDKKLPRKKIHLLADEALAAGVITKEDFEMLRDAEEVRWDAVQVDDFTQDEYLNGLKGRADMEGAPNVRREVTGGSAGGNGGSLRTGSPKTGNPGRAVKGI